jgi:hypothetical protein
MDKIVHKGETIYLQKDLLGWRVVEPIREPETKVFIWKNFFSKKGFFILGIIILFLLIFYLAFNEQITNYRQVLSNPCDYCSSFKEESFIKQDINLTNNITNLRWGE